MSADSQDLHIFESIDCKQVAIVSLPVEDENGHVLSSQSFRYKEADIRFSAACSTENSHVLNPFVVAKSERTKFFGPVENSAQLVFALDLVQRRWLDENLSGCASKSQMLCSQQA